MRIGITTFWQSADNYGQALQCFALQQQLTKIGHEPFLIKYIPSQDINPTSIAEKLWKLIQIYPIFLKLKRMRKAKLEKAFALKASPADGPQARHHLRHNRARSGHQREPHRQERKGEEGQIRHPCPIQHIHRQ